MPSPDLTPYVDLRVFDQDPQDIFDSAITNLQVDLPEWSPREGNTEVMLLEAMALEVAESVFAINRLPGTITEILLLLYGIVRDIGQQPTVNLTFQLSDTLGHDIPAGTQVRLDLSGGLLPIVFSTDVALTVAAGSSTGVVAATGDRFTSDANGTATLTLVALLDAVAFVDSVRTNGLVANGRDEESDDDWLTRGIQRFQRISETLVLPKHFTSQALENPIVERATTLDNFNSALGTGVPGDHPGFVTVAVYGDNRFLTTPEKAALDVTFEALAMANLSVSVIDPTITAVNVTANVHGLAGFTNAEIIANVTAALQLYLSPMTWEWSGTVRRNELISIISNTAGVDFLNTLTTPASDTSLSGVAPLANAGTITITVT